eukprot:2857854-Alexandrium_andersonii.AAC.1
MSASLVGSEMCIRDSLKRLARRRTRTDAKSNAHSSNFDISEFAVLGNLNRASNTYVPELPGNLPCTFGHSRAFSGTSGQLWALPGAAP